MSLQVLVVDDSGVMRAIVIKSLKVAGLDMGQVHQAGNGQEGLDILEANDVDIAFIDINMPVMDGMEMIERVRQDDRWQNLPIVVISTEGSETRIECIEHHGAKFIHKPFDPETVREALRGVVEIGNAQNA